MKLLIDRAFSLFYELKLPEMTGLLKWVLVRGQMVSRLPKNPLKIRGVLAANDMSDWLSRSVAIMYVEKIGWIQLASTIVF